MERRGVVARRGELVVDGSGEEHALFPAKEDGRGEWQPEEELWSLMWRCSGMCCDERCAEEEEEEKEGGRGEVPPEECSPAVEAADAFEEERRKEPLASRWTMSSILFLSTTLSRLSHPFFVDSGGEGEADEGGEDESRCGEGEEEEEEGEGL